MAKANSSLVSNPASNFEVIMLDDGRIAVAFDPKKTIRPSKSGKNMLISSTGTVALQDFSVSLNAYRKG